MPWLLYAGDLCFCPHSPYRNNLTEETRIPEPKLYQPGQQPIPKPVVIVRQTKGQTSGSSPLCNDYYTSTHMTHPLRYLSYTVGPIRP